MSNHNEACSWSQLRCSNQCITCILHCISHRHMWTERWLANIELHHEYSIHTECLIFFFIVMKVFCEHFFCIYLIKNIGSCSRDLYYGIVASLETSSTPSALSFGQWLRLLCLLGHRRHKLFCTCCSVTCFKLLYLRMINFLRVFLINRRTLLP